MLFFRTISFVFEKLPFGLFAFCFQKQFYLLLRHINKALSIKTVIKFVRMESVAKYDFNATNADELSFRKGQILKLLNNEQGTNWSLAECEGRTGLIPKNHIDMKPHSWYHGKISRVKSEQMLNNCSYRDGTFLVRDSEGTPNGFSLSVKCGTSVQHYKILTDTPGKYFIWVVKFNSINELVSHHRGQSISRTQNIMLVDIPTGVGQKHQTFTVQAAFDFRRQEAGELEFRKGDRIMVTECMDKNWWSGTFNGQVGIFPANHVIVPPAMAAKLGLH